MKTAVVLAATISLCSPAFADNWCPVEGTVAGWNLPADSWVEVANHNVILHRGTDAITCDFTTTAYELSCPAQLDGPCAYGESKCAMFVEFDGEDVMTLQPDFDVMRQRFVPCP